MESITAMQRVISTPELLELVLSFLPALEILTTARLVCHLFSSMVVTSPLLRAVTWNIGTFKTPVVSHGATHINEIQICSLLQPMFRRIWKYMCMNPQLSGTSYSQEDREKAIDQYRAKARMPYTFLTSPPLEQISVSIKHSARHRQEFGIITTPGGVTFSSFMLQIAELIWKMVDKEVADGSEIRPPWNVVIRIHAEPNYILPGSKSKLESGYNSWPRDVKGIQKLGRVTALCRSPWEVLFEEGEGGAWENKLSKELVTWYESRRGPGTSHIPH